MENLKKFAAINAVAGDECKIRDEILALFPHGTLDNIGNIYVKKGENPTIALIAHMDEVGFIISGATPNGLLKFKPVGGIDPLCCIGKRVLIGVAQTLGVIGSLAFHLQDRTEREKVPKFKDLYIDIGANSASEAEPFVGEYATFASDFCELGEHRLTCKAFDNRAGCALLAKLLTECECDFYGVFTVQEEIGLRGAKVVSNRLSAEKVIILETTTANDYDAIPASKHVTTLGAGPALTFMDGSQTASTTINAQIVDIAEKKGITWQYKRATTGGTDGGAFFTPVAIISLPCRNLHSAFTTIDKRDYHNTFELLKACLEGGIL